MSEKKKQWIMTEEQYNAFCTWRQTFYKSICTSNELECFPDEKLMKYYVWNIVNFLRSRKSQADRPFKFQKVIFSVVCFIKRYYLVNSFVDQQPMQTCITALYVAFKLNQYSDDYIRKMVLSLRGKQALEPKRGHYHYGEDGYADKEFKLLSGIGFQTARTKMIHTIESLYGKIQQSDTKNIESLLLEIRDILTKVYINSSLIFLEQGPKIGLGIVLVALQKIGCSMDFKKVLGEKFLQMLTTRKQQIDLIKSKIEKLQTYNEHTVKEDNPSYYRKLTKAHYRKPQFKKSPRFHARHDSMVFDQ